jgi:hypothetical protein
VSAL